MVLSRWELILRLLLAAGLGGVIALVRGAWCAPGFAD